MFLLISDNLAEVPELKDISYDERDSKLTSYLIIALVSVSTFFLTFIIIVLGVRCDGTGTLRSTYNYDGYMTTGSRTSDFKFVSSYNDNTLPADQTLRKSPTDFSDVFGDCDHSPETRLLGMFTVALCNFFFQRRRELLYCGGNETWIVIGNIAKDTGLNLGRLSARRARVDSEDNGVQYCSVNLNTGELLVQERIDREAFVRRRLHVF
ncbi:hypothetical protein WMY93_009640 [Mugilogobius chulae]|uniref:Cadherin N-terminal domain-containing protein n=1 Tax=Mugilogobius chulae TaxID=88201 RepID=A0AAW0PL58_9GOBI